MSDESKECVRRVVTYFDAASQRMAVRGMRNHKLVMTAGIWTKIWTPILSEYEVATFGHISQLYLYGIN